VVVVTGDGGGVGGECQVLWMVVVVEE